MWTLYCTKLTKQNSVCKFSFYLNDQYLFLCTSTTIRYNFGRMPYQCSLKGALVLQYHPNTALKCLSVNQGYRCVENVDKMGWSPNSIFLQTRHSRVKGAMSQFALLQKLGLNFSSSLFIIRINLLHPLTSLFFFDLLLSLWCFSIWFNYYFQVSVSLRHFKATKIIKHTVTQLL